jgi:hypothetical protein
MGAAVGGTARRRRLRVAEWGALCVTVAALVSYGIGHVGLTSNHGIDQAAARPPQDAQVFELHWRADQLLPARSAGHICVTDAIHGRICTGFLAGEVPATTLTHELERRGLHVRATVLPGD